MSSPTDKRESANKTGVEERNSGDPAADFELSAEQADMVASCFRPAWEVSAPQPGAPTTTPKPQSAASAQPAASQPSPAQAPKPSAASPEAAPNPAAASPAKPQPQPPTPAPAAAKAVRPDATPKKSEPPASAAKADTKADFKKTVAWDPKDRATKEESAKPKFPSAQAHTQPLVLETRHPAQPPPEAPREPKTTAKETPLGKQADKRNGPVVVSGVVQVAGSPGTPPSRVKSDPPRAAESAANRPVKASPAPAAPPPAAPERLAEPTEAKAPEPEQQEPEAERQAPAAVPEASAPSVVIAQPDPRDRQTDPPLRRRASAAEPEPISERVPGVPASSSPIKWVVIGALGTAAAFAIAIVGMWMIMKGDGTRPPATAQPASTPVPTQVATPVTATPTATVAATATASATATVSATATETAKTPEPVKTSEKPPEPAKTAVAATTTTPPAKKAPEATPTTQAKTPPPAKTSGTKTGGGGIVRETPF